MCASALPFGVSRRRTWCEYSCTHTSLTEMFRVLHKETRAEIISIDPRWRSCLDELRAFDQSDMFVCPECHAPTRLRAGEHNRWHFAHKNAGDCPLNESDPERIRLRALIYSWLAAKEPKLSLGIEERLNVDNKVYVVDCVVDLQNGPRVAYFALTAGMRNRDALFGVARNKFPNSHWIFHAKTLKQSSSGQISLNTTQRDLMNPLTGAPTKYSGATLHFLDPQSNTLTTFRSLQCNHPPQGFRGFKRETPLEKILISPKTGLLLHPEEVSKYRDKTKSDPAKRRLFQSATARTFKVPISIKNINRSNRSDNIHKSSSGQIFCERCGCLTTNWDHLTSPGYCVCRECT